MSLQKYAAAFEAIKNGIDYLALYLITYNTKIVDQGKTKTY